MSDQDAGDVRRMAERAQMIEESAREDVAALRRESVALRERLDALEQAATEALSLMRWEHWDKDNNRPDKRAAVARLAELLDGDDHV